MARQPPRRSGPLRDGIGPRAGAIEQKPMLGASAEAVPNSYIVDERERLLPPTPYRGAPARLPPPLEPRCNPTPAPSLHRPITSEPSFAHERTPPVGASPQSSCVLRRTAPPPQVERL